MKKFVFLLLIAPLVSMAMPNIYDDKHIKHTLLKYNTGIIKMTRSGDTKLLKNMLSQEVYFKLMVWADSWKFSNLAMVAKINDIRFSPIAYNENNATVRTLENWSYAYANLATKDYALEPTTIFYKMKYTLKKHHDSWIIVAVDKLEEETFSAQKKHKPDMQKKELPKDDTSDKQGKIDTH